MIKQIININLPVYGGLFTNIINAMSYSFELSVRFGWIKISVKWKVNIYLFIIKIIEIQWNSYFLVVNQMVFHYNLYHLQFQYNQDRFLYHIHQDEQIFYEFILKKSKKMNFNKMNLINEKMLTYNSPKSLLLKSSTQCAAVTIVRPPVQVIVEIICWFDFISF